MNTKGECIVSEEKRNKIIAACTVNAILLVIILFAVMIYQFVVMANLGAKKKQIEQDIATYQEKIDNAQKDIDYYNSEQGIITLLVKNKIIGN
jgi:cell division protein FtsL